MLQIWMAVTPSYSWLFNSSTYDTMKPSAGFPKADVSMLNDLLQFDLITDSDSFNCGQEVFMHITDHQVTLQTGPYTGTWTQNQKPAAKQCKIHLGETVRCGL